MRPGRRIIFFSETCARGLLRPVAELGDRAAGGELAPGIAAGHGGGLPSAGGLEPRPDPSPPFYTNIATLPFARATSALRSRLMICAGLSLFGAAIVPSPFVS